MNATNTNSVESTDDKIIYSLDTTPWYFGVYLNMARLNLYMVNNHIANKTGLFKAIVGIEHIKNIVFLNKGVLQKNIAHANLFELGERHLPLLKSFNDQSWSLFLKQYDRSKKYEGITKSSIERMTNSLNMLISKINDFRNYTSHYSSIENTLPLLCSDEFIEELKATYEKAFTLAKSRFEEVFSAENFALAGSMVDELFKGSLITNRGLAFYACLFLDKEKAFLLLNRLKGFKRTRDGNDGNQEFFFVREVFTVFCLKLPHEKLHSLDLENAMKMDFINYLCRIPNELYQVLPTDKQLLFEPKLDLGAKKNIVDNSINTEMKEDVEFDYDDYIRQTSSKRRYEDRFPFFAMQYLDSKESFSYLFEIKVGKGLIDGYIKPIKGCNVTEDNRFIERELTCHQKLNDVTKYKEEFVDWQSKGIPVPEKQDKNSLIYNFDRASLKYIKSDSTKGKRNKQERLLLFKESFNCAPQYDVSANKIGISRKMTTILSGKQPDAFLSIHELHKVALLEYLAPGVAQTIIEDFLKKNNSFILNAGVLDEMKDKLGYDNDPLQRFNKMGSTQEETLKEYEKEYAKRKDCLDRCLQEYKLKSSQLPQRVLDYLLNITKTDEKHRIKEYLKGESEVAKQYAKQIEKGKLNLKIGEMASILARDIVYHIIGENTKKKVTSFYYNLMQSYLATWGDEGQQKLFWSLVDKDLNLLSSSGHPFLGKIRYHSLKTTRDFFREYYKHKGFMLGDDKKTRIDWLFKTFYVKGKDGKTVVAIPANDKLLPQTYIRRKKEISSINDWLGQVGKESEKPIHLPINLFDDKLIEVLKTKLSEQGKDTTHVNGISKLVELYLSNDSQQMYSYNRVYTLFEDKPFKCEVLIKPTEDAKLSEYYKKDMDRTFKVRKEEYPNLNENDHQKLFKHAIDNHEKVIRYYLLRDRISVLMLRDLLHTQSLVLNDFTPIKGEGILSDRVEIKEQINNGCNIVGSCKRRDYGKFKKVLRDPRLAVLTHDVSEISFDKIISEFASYDRESVYIFEKINALEEFIYVVNDANSVPPYPEWAMEDGVPNFRKVMVNGLLEKFVEKGELNETPLIINREEMRALGEKEGHELFDTTDFYDSLTDDVVKDVFLVILIRNKFSHNQYPSKPFMDVIFERVKSTEAYQKGEVKSYAQAILLCLTKLIESLKEKLNNHKS